MCHPCARGRHEGLTQSAIGERIGWSRSAINNYQNLTDKVDTEVLAKCKAHQKGRVSKDDTTVSYSFTENWFRNSGLYKLAGRSGRIYNRTKKAEGGRSDRDFSGDQNDTPKTADTLAEQYGTSTCRQHHPCARGA